LNVKVYVDNLPKSITQGELNAMFSQAGEVTSIDLNTDRNSGEVKGFAFVTMGTQSGAKKTSLTVQPSSVIVSTLFTSSAVVAAVIPLSLRSIPF
jgi:RNA recognition motif-containing protein